MGQKIRSLLNPRTVGLLRQAVADKTDKAPDRVKTKHPIHREGAFADKSHAHQGRERSRRFKAIDAQRHGGRVAKQIINDSDLYLAMFEDDLARI